MGIELVLVYFVYGLAFFAMGLAILLETGRAASPTQASSLGWLAAFGLVHGTHEWMEAYLLQGQAAGTLMPAWLGWVRVVLLASSFACLLVYALLSLRHVSPDYKKRSLHITLTMIWAAAILASAFFGYQNRAVPWVNLIDAVSRYVLAVPAAFLASVALRADGRNAAAEGRHPVAANLQLAAFGFAIYACTQVFVHPLQFFPARLINLEAFLSLTGLPIQALRAAMALLVSIGLIRAAHALEQERRSQLLAAHQARVAAVEQRDALRRDLLRHTVRSQEDERARIARELHDEIAQLLSAFSLELGALRTKLRRRETMQSVDHLQSLSRQMSQGLYHLVRDLRPSHLDNLGLIPALNYLFTQEFRPKGLEVGLDVTGSQHALSGPAETALFRIAQESLTNVIRHAQVGQARVSLHYAADCVTMRISDEGLGFNPSEEFAPPRGWGLVGMRERVETLGGQLCIRSSPGGGTVVEVTVPIRKNEGEGKETADGIDQTVVGG